MNNNMNNDNSNNNQEQNQQYPNINAYQDDYGGMGGESEEEILQRILELSKKEY